MSNRQRTTRSNACSVTPSPDASNGRMDIWLWSEREEQKLFPLLLLAVVLMVRLVPLKLVIRSVDKVIKVSQLKA